MFSSKNIICSDLEEGNNLTATEQFNISIDLLTLLILITGLKPK